MFRGSFIAQVMAPWNRSPRMPFKLGTHKSTLSYQLTPFLHPLRLRARDTRLSLRNIPTILVLPQLLLSTVILNHKPCLHLASTLPILIFLLLVMGPIVAMKLLLALEVKNCLWCQSTCLLLNRTPIVGLSRLNMVRFTIFRYLCKIHFSHVFIPFW